MISTAENSSRHGATSPSSSASNASGSTLAHRARAMPSQQQAVRSTVLPQQLTAPAAGHQEVSLTVHAHHRHEPSTAGRVQRRDEPALRAQREAVRRVLDVAADHDATVIDECGRADRERRVRRVRIGHRIDGGGPQGVPVEVSLIGRRVRLAVGGRGPDASDEPGHGEDRGEVRQHREERRRDRHWRADDGEHRLQRVREPEQQGRRDRAPWAPPPEDDGRQGDESLAGADVLAEAADLADREERAAEAGDETRRDDVDVPRPQDVDAHGVGRPWVLADGAGAQAPPGAEQRDVHADDRARRSCTR